MSLPLPIIERLFLRLGATYGRDFMGRYEGQDAQAVKAIWAQEMSGYTNHLKAIAWALENLPERSPNVIEFRAICRRAPIPDITMLPSPKADPERVAAELAKLEQIKADAPHGMKEWAYRLKARYERGDRINQYQEMCFRSALGLYAPLLDAS